MSDPAVTKQELRKKLEDLLRRQKQQTKEKENAATVYNDELKQIRQEIDHTLGEIDDLNSV